ncbi:MAG TPA: hypothetical protein PLF66_14170 [Leptospiraceae bacterium]|nr:hypothetical protein [Leptospiraceae bacterium]
MPSCHACHSDGGGSPLNNFGKAFKDGGSNLAAFGKIAAQDSDGDGTANEAEAKAKSNPGSKNSLPGKAGNWLETSSLIPKEVQAAFSNIQTWQLRDAVLTSNDIEAAKKMGGNLSASDENTIYIPLENQYPVGTAIIFPVTFQAKTFYLLLTTDKQLKIKQVQVLDAREVPAAKNSKVYSTFTGQQAQSLPSKNGESLDDVISNTVKNAGILLYVRLRGA